MSNFDELKKNYATHYANFNPLGQALPKSAERYYDAQLTFLRESFDYKNKKILDVGTGSGFLVDYFLKHQAKNIDTLEIDPALYNFAVEKYKENPSVRALNGNVTDFVFDKKYDIIICFDVIEHLPAEQGIEMLKKFYNSLSMGGIAIIRTENMANICVGNFSRFMDLTHCTGYTEFSLKQAFDVVGFKNFAVIDPQFPRFSRLWRNYMISKTIQKFLISIQDRRVPVCLHKDLLCYAIKTR